MNGLVKTIHVHVADLISMMLFSLNLDNLGTNHNDLYIQRSLIVIYIILVSCYLYYIG